MKHLKSFKEHYDTEELQVQFEIPELRGEIDFANLVSNKIIITDKDADKFGQTFVKLASDIPFLKNFDVSKDDSSLIFYKKVEKEFSENEKTIATIIISIDVNDDDSYVLVMNAKVFGYIGDMETILYTDVYNHQLMNGINSLRGVFRSTVLYKIKEWSNNVKRYIGYDFMEEDVEKTRFNLRYN